MGAAHSVRFRKCRRPAHTRVRRPVTLLSVSALRVALVAFGATVLTAACAAGQNAQTAVEKPSYDGTQGSVGQINLVNVSLHTPPGSGYAAGSDVAMTVYIANSAQSADKLTNVSSPSFPGGWSVVKTSTLTSSPGSATPLPATSSSTAAAAPSTGTPQAIGAGSAIGLGLSGIGANGGDSTKTLVLKGLASNIAPLTPGMSVKVTFTFANAGQATLTVPVHLSSAPNTQTLTGSNPPQD